MRPTSLLICLVGDELLWLRLLPPLQRSSAEAGSLPVPRATLQTQGPPPPPPPRQLPPASPPVVLALCPRGGVGQWFTASSKGAQEDGGLLDQWRCIFTFRVSYWKPFPTVPVDDCPGGRTCMSRSIGRSGSPCERPLPDAL